MARPAMRGSLPIIALHQRTQPVLSARLIVQQRRQPATAQPLLFCPAQLDHASARTCSFVPQAFAIEADGSPLFSTAADHAPVGDGFGSDREVHAAREQAPQEEASFVDRLRAAAGQAAAGAGRAAARLRSFTLRLASLVAKSIVLGVAAQLSHRQCLQRLATEQRTRAQVKLAAAAVRHAAQDRLRAGLAERSKADCAFVKILLLQDNPARTLEDKWADLSGAMHGNRAPELRKRTAQLFAAALDSSQAVQQAIATEAAKGSKALDRLVGAHGCVKQEEALRSEIFAQILAGS